MKLIVKPHTIEIVKDLVNEKEIDITKCEFEFSDEITDDYVKEAYFTYNGTTYKQIIQNNECKIPYEVLEKPSMIEIGVVAYKLENDEYVKRYNPSPAYFNSIVGSLKEQYENSEPITPTDKEQMEQALADGLEDIQNAIDEVDGKIQEVNTAIEETNNLDIDVNKVGKEATIDLTKKDGTQKEVKIYDGTSLQFMWQGTSLGIKTDDMQDYVFVNLQGIQGVPGPQGEPFRIKKTYSSVAEMNADFNNMNYGDYVMIASTVEVEDNAKLYTRGEYEWIFITDFSGATGIKGETGATPNIQIGTVVSGATPSVTRTGTNENPILNFVLEKGEIGETGNGIERVEKISTTGLVDTYRIYYTDGNIQDYTITNGEQGDPGNGIDYIEKTSTSGLVDTYTIYYTNGNEEIFEVTNGKDGEVTQEQFDELKAELDRYKLLENALPHVSGTGTSITLNNTAKAGLKNELDPSELEQETTTGKNLFSGMNSLGSGTTYTNGVLTITSATSNISNIINVLSSTSYTITIDTLATSTRMYVLEYDSDGNRINTFTSYSRPYTFTTSENTKTIDIRFSPSSGETFPITISKIMLRLASITDDTYEKYSGGLPQPNPQYPSDIHVISGDNSIKVQNTNIWDEEWEQGYYNANGNPIVGTSSVRSKNYIRVEPNTSIYLYNGTDSNGRICYYDKNKNFISTQTSTNISKTTPSNCYYARISTGTTYGGTYKNDISIYYGTTNLGYIKHEEQVAPLNLGDLEYCRIGTYKDKFFKAIDGDSIYDTLDSTTKATLTYGKWYMFKKNPLKVFNGTENWSYSSSTGCFYTTEFPSIETMDFLSNMFTKTTVSFLNMPNGTARFSAIDNSRWNVKYDEYTNVDDFKNWLSTHNVKVYYVAKEPQYILLNDTLQQQLDDIYYAMLSYQGQTNISQVNDDLPFEITSTALRDLSSIADL